MTAFNVVKFKVKLGAEQTFLDANRKQRTGMDGFLGGSIIKTGDRTYCLIGEWKSWKNLVNARPEMIGVLDEIRPLLEDLGGGLGVTDPTSGEVVAKMPRPKAAKKAATKAPRKASKKTAAGRGRKGAEKRAAKRRR